MDILSYSQSLQAQEKIEDVKKKLDDKADSTRLDDKADKSYVDTKLAEKADVSALDGKADKTYVDAELSNKASLTALSLRAEKIYVDAELTKKADKTELDAKADQSYVTAELADIQSLFDEEVIPQRKSLTNLIENGRIDPFPYGVESGNLFVWDANGQKEVDGRNVIDGHRSDYAQISYIYFNSIAGHKYYVTSKVKGRTEFREVDPNGHRGDIIILRNNPNWGRLSCIKEATETKTKVMVASQYREFDAGYFMDIIVIDLTAEFGAGKEPTESEMDVSIESVRDGWFSGTIVSEERNPRFVISEARPVNPVEGLVWGQIILPEPLPVRGYSIRFDANELPLDDGNAVNEWGDISGEGHHISQHAASLRPTYITEGLNGKPAVRFTGSEFLTGNTSPNFTNSFTFFGVVFFDTSVRTSSAGLFLSGVEGVSAVWMRFSESHDGVGVMVNNEVTTYTSKIPAFAVYCARYSGGSLKMYVNGVQQTEVTYSNPISAQDMIVLGANSQGLYGLSGEVSEFVAYKRALTEVEVSTLSTYLMEKWSISP